MVRGSGGGPTLPCAQLLHVGPLWLHLAHQVWQVVLEKLLERAPRMAFAVTQLLHHGHLPLHVLRDDIFNLVFALA